MVVSNRNEHPKHNCHPADGREEGNTGRPGHAEEPDTAQGENAGAVSEIDPAVGSPLAYVRAGDLVTWLAPCPLRR